MKKILALILLAACLLSSLSGCYYYGAGAVTDNLLVPPKLTAKQSEIYKALEEQVGSNINLRYPKTGEYRSAFVIKNIDNEPTNEALVFYQKITNTTKPASLRLSILDQQENRWISTYEAAAEGTDIHQVDFSNFSTTDSMFIIIGYTMTSEQDNVMHIYRYQDGKITDLFSQPYTLMQLVDIDNDGYQELVALTTVSGKDNLPSTTTANVIKYRKGGFEIVDTVEMDAEVSSYLNVKTGFVGNNVSALYLDGMKGKNKMKTQILFYENGKLQNNFALDKEIDQQLTRQAGILSMDIDQDGIIEIPVLELMPGYTDQTELAEGNAQSAVRDNLYFTHWNVFRDGKFEEKMLSYVNMSFGYALEIPEEMRGKITAQRFTETNEVVFYEYGGSLADTWRELFRLRVRNQKEAEEDAAGYRMITTSGQLTYQAKLPDFPTSLLEIDLRTIRDGFRLIKQ